MGHIEFLLKDLFTRLDVDFIIPPPNSTETIKLGVRHAPELACYPLKVTLGNFIEGLEKGADTLIMAGGVGPCRFGYYAETQRRILKQLGYSFEMIRVEPPAAHPIQFIKSFKRVAPKKKIREIWKAIKVSFSKAQVMDFIEKKVLAIRPFEVNKGETTKTKKKAIKLLDQAFLESEIEKAKEEALNLLDSIPQDKEKPFLKIGLVGEFYLLLEPFVNFDLEELLGNMDIYLERGVYLTDWIGPSSKNPVMGVSNEEIAQAAFPYLSHFVGGEGRQTVGHTIIFAYQGFDGVIHLMPFTCMPELIAKSILPKISQDLDFPILTLVFDEQTGKAGLITRIEAFVELLISRRRKGLSPKRLIKIAYRGDSLELTGWKRR